MYKVSMHSASTRFLSTTVTNEDVNEIHKILSPRDGENMLANVTLTQNAGEGMG